MASTTDGASYQAQWFTLDNLNDEERAVGNEVELPQPTLQIPQEAWGPADDAGFRYAIARLSTIQEDNRRWREPVVLTLRDRGGRYDVAGLQRPRCDAAIKTKTEKQALGTRDSKQSSE